MEKQLHNDKNITLVEMAETLMAECDKYNDCDDCPLNNHYSCGWGALPQNQYWGKHFEEMMAAYYEISNKQQYNQEAKADAGKPKVSLVPMQIVRDIARIREYGCDKYHDPENWKRVEKERYIDALGRHTLAFLNNPMGVDEESGLPHLWHLECNAAFLSEIMKGEFK